MNNRQEFYVHVQLADGNTVVAGFHSIHPEKNLGTFIYGRSYCDNPNAFSLDPINLPLIFGKEFHFPLSRFNQSGIPGVLLDAGPDEWGKRILNRFCEHKPVSAADYLVMGSGFGVGALKFSDSPTSINEYSADQYSELETLYQSAIAFDQNEDVQSQLENFLMPSSGIGGARPKAHIIHNNKHKIAKFNRKDDAFDNVLSEFCMMQMAAECGIDCAKTELVQTSHGCCLLVERFDINESNDFRHHMISANSLLNIIELEQLNNASYELIANIGKKISNSKSLASDVFKRMLFNIVIGNTDDHTRNHAFLKAEKNNSYVLSPAYDLVPLPFRIGSHAINIGPFGQMPSLENIKACARMMGLDNSEQESICEDILDNMVNYQEKLAHYGMSKQDIQYLQECFNNLKTLEKYKHTL